MLYSIYIDILCFDRKCGVSVSEPRKSKYYGFMDKRPFICCCNICADMSWKIIMEDHWQLNLARSPTPIWIVQVGS